MSVCACVRVCPQAHRQVQALAAEKRKMLSEAAAAREASLRQQIDSAQQTVQAVIAEKKAAEQTAIKVRIGATCVALSEPVPAPAMCGRHAREDWYAVVFPPSLQSVCAWLHVCGCVHEQTAIKVRMPTA